MDIWNSMLGKTILPDENLSDVQESSLIDKHSSFLRNKMIDLASNKTIISFVSQYIKKRGLTASYALNRSCFKIIDISVVSIKKSNENSFQDIEDIVRIHFESFPETQEIIDEKLLIQEMKDVAEGKNWSGDHLITPHNMLTLGQLSHQLQRSIEDGSWEMNEKADAFMCSLTLGNYKYFDYESFVYQLSRGIEIEDTIDNLIPYLQKEAKNRASRYSSMSKDFMDKFNWDHLIHYYEAEVLRIVQWAQIGNLEDSVEVFCREMFFRLPMRYSSISSGTSRLPLFLSYITHPYSLLRSDLAIKKIYTKLTEYIHHCQDRLCENLALRLDNEFHELFIISTAAFYLFGAYRLGVDQFDSYVINESMKFIKSKQLEDGSFLSSEVYGLISLEIDAIIAHALWISETFGWERSLRRITKYFLDTQNKYGFWDLTGFANVGYTTGLVLDTLELTKDNPKLSFAIPEHKKKKNAKIPTKENYSFQHLINSIDRETIQNILGLFSGKTQSTPQDKCDTTLPPPKTQTAEEIELDDYYIELLSNTYLVIEDKGELTVYNNEESKKVKGCTGKWAKLFIDGSADRIYSLEKKEFFFIPEEVDNELKQGKSKRSKIIRDINKAMINMLKQNNINGYGKIPENFKIIRMGDKGKYICFLPIFTKKNLEERNKNLEEQNNNNWKKSVKYQSLREQKSGKDIQFNKLLNSKDYQNTDQDIEID